MSFVFVFAFGTNRAHGGCSLAAGWQPTSPKKSTANANNSTIEVDDNDKSTAALKEQRAMEVCSCIRREKAEGVIA